MADDTDFDDSEFDDIDAMLNSADDVPGLEDPSEDRSATDSIASNIGDAVDSNLELDKIGKSFKKSLGKSLPDGIGDKLDDALYAGDEIVDNTLKTLTGARKSVGSTMDGVADLLPEFIAGPIRTLSKAIKPETDDYGSTREMSEDERIAEQLKSVLGESKSADAVRAEQASVIQALSSEKESVILSNIAANTKAALDMKIDLDSKYYRKDLELQMKQTLTLIKIADIMSRDSEVHTKQLEAVVKNTALPDFARTRGSEFVKQMMMKQAGDVGLNAFKSSSVYNKVAKNATNLINGKISQFVQGTESLNGITDMVSSMSEAGVSPLAMLVDMLVETGVNKATDFATKKVTGEMMKHQGGQDAIKNLDKVMSDPETALKYMSEESAKHDDGEASRKTKVLNTMSELTSGSKMRTSYNVVNDNNLNDATFMDNRTKKTQNEVVPNLLSKILAEVTTIRKGSGLVNPTDDDKLSYDFNSGTFKSKTEVKDIATKKIEQKAEALVRSIDNKQLISALAGTDKLPNDVKQDLLNALMKYLLAGKSTSMYYMKQEGLLDYIKNPTLRQTVGQNLEVLTNEAEVELSPEVSEKNIETIKELNSKLERTQKSSIANYKDIVDSVKNSTDDSVLQELGLTDKLNNNVVSSTNISNLNQKFGEKHIKNMFNKKEEPEVPKKGFKTGGGTGDGKVDEVAGVVHKKEFVLNADKTKQLIQDVKNVDLENINKTVTGIAKEVLSTKTVKNVDMDFNKTLSSLNSKISTIGEDTKNYFTKLITKEDKLSLKPVTPYNKGIKLDNFKTKDKTEFKDLKDISDEVVNDITSLFKTVSSRVVSIKDTTLKNADEYISNMDTSWSGVSKLFTDRFESLKKTIPSNFDELKTGISTLTGTLGKEVTKLTSYLPESFQNTFTDITKTIKETDYSKLATEGLQTVNKTLTNNKFNKQTGLATNLSNVNSKGNLSNKTNNFNTKNMTFKDRNPNETDNVLTNAIRDLGSIFTDVGKVITDKDSKVTDIMGEVAKKGNDTKSLSTFMESTSKLLNSVMKSNDKLKDTKVNIDASISSDNSVDFKTTKDKPKEDKGIIGNLFSKGTSKVSETITEIQKVFDGSKSVDSEVLENIKSMDEAIKNKGVEAVMSNGLAELPLPESYSEAMHSYKQVINSMDPTGNLWKNLSSKENFVEDMQTLHARVIEDKQKGLLVKAGEKIDNGLDKAGGLMGDARDKFIRSLPLPLQGYAKKFLKNKFTKFGGKLTGRLKKAFKGAGKATLQEFKMLGKNVKDTFVDKHGKVHMPNAIDLTKLVGKTAFGTSKALSVGVKELYPELFGAAKDTAGLATSTAWKAMGIKKASTRMYNKAKALVKPPIPRELYNSWKSGEMTGKQVMDKLDGKDKEKWAEWLKTNTRPGFTLPEMLATGGSWFAKTAVGTSKVVKPTYKGIGSGALKGAAFVGKGLFNFTGIPSLFKTKKDVDEADKKAEEKSIEKNRKKNPLKFIELIETKYLDNFTDDLNWINKEIKVSKQKIETLNTPMDTFKKSQRNGLIAKLKAINTLYVLLDKTKNMTYNSDIDIKLTELLNYINAITTKVVKGKKKKVNVKDVKEEKETKAPKPIKSEGFKKGGYTGDGAIDEISDVVHKKEFVINHKDLTSIVKNKLSMSHMKDKIIDSVKGSKLFKGISNVKDKVTNLSSKALITISSIFSKKLDYSNNKLSIIANALTKKNDYRDKDGDGDRDGNAVDRAKKLFSKQSDALNKRLKVMTGNSLRGVKKTCFGGSTCMERLITRMSLAVGVAVAGYFGIKKLSKINYLEKIHEGIDYAKGMWDKFKTGFNAVKDVLTSTFDVLKKTFYYTKNIGNNISIKLRSALSHVWGLEKLRPSNKELLQNEALNKGEVISNNTTTNNSVINNHFKEKILADKKAHPELSVTGEVSPELKAEMMKFAKEKNLKLKDESLTLGDTIAYGAGGLTATGLLSTVTRGYSTKIMKGIVKAPFKYGYNKFKESRADKAFDSKIKSAMGGNPETPKETFKSKPTRKPHVKNKNFMKVKKPAIPEVPKKGFFGKTTSWLSEKASSSFKFLKSKIGIPNSIKKMIPKFLKILETLKGKIATKLSGRLLARVSEKIGSRLIPGLGWALLAWDVGNILKYMFMNNLSFMSAVSLQFTDIDFFKDDTKVVDEDKTLGMNLNNDIDEAKKKDYYIKASNNSTYKKKTYSKTNEDVITDLKSTVSSPKPLSTDAIKVPLEPLMDNLKRDEGVRLSKYKDSLGYDTIGVGHLLDKRKGGKSLRETLGINKPTITKQESDYLLINDINDTSKDLYSKFPWLTKHPVNIQSDLTNMAFNLGVNGLAKFKNSLKSIRQFDYKKAATNLQDSLWYRQVGPRAQRIISDIAGTPVNNVETVSPVTTSAMGSDIGSVVKEKLANQTVNKVEVAKDTKPTPVIPNITVAPSNVTVDTKHIADVSTKSNDLLSKSIKVQYGTLDKISELVDINKNMLEVMQGGQIKNTSKKQASGNNKTYSLPAYDEVMSHKVDEF